MGQVDLHPFDLGDLFFLRGVLEGFGLPKKVDDVLGGVPLGGVGDDLPEGGVQLHVDTRFFLDLPKGGLLFGFAGLYMTFGERPVAADHMLDQKQLDVSMIFPENHCSAGFFIRHCKNPFVQKK